MITHAHRPNAKNVILGFKFPQNVKIYPNLHFENLTPKHGLIHVHTG